MRAQRVAHSEKSAKGKKEQNCWSGGGSSLITHLRQECENTKFTLFQPDATAVADKGDDLQKNLLELHRKFYYSERSKKNEDFRKP
jgi:hypothetical protein